MCFLSGLVGSWELWFIPTEHSYLDSLSYIKKQQEQAEAQKNNIIKAINSGSLFSISVPCIEAR